MKVIGSVLGVVVIGAIIAVILGLPLMLLWNWLMPIIFGLTKIGFLQAVGLSFLCSILFKNTSSSNND